MKGGEPDESGVSKQILNDFNRGKIPWFVPPPKDEEKMKTKLVKIRKLATRERDKKEKLLRKSYKRKKKIKMKMIKKLRKLN